MKQARPMRSSDDYNNHHPTRKGQEPISISKAMDTISKKTRRNPSLHAPHYTLPPSQRDPWSTHHIPHAETTPNSQHNKPKQAHASPSGHNTYCPPPLISLTISILVKTSKSAPAAGFSLKHSPTTLISGIPAVGAWWSSCCTAGNWVACGPRT